MKLKTERTEIDILSDAKSKGIKLAPLSKYFVGQTSNMSFQNVYVMNYSSIDLEQLPLIFDALCHILIK
jgi:GntR family transcriptional regulator/MocR family aminotransferase